MTRQSAQRGLQLVDVDDVVLAIVDVQMSRPFVQIDRLCWTRASFVALEIYKWAISSVKVMNFTLISPT